MTAARLKGMMAVVLAAGIISACGGGGGGGGVSVNLVPTSAVMTILTTAVTATAYPTAGIGGVGLSIRMPGGVSVATTAGSVDSSVVVPSGVAQGKASVLAVYTAASGTYPGKLDIVTSSTTSAGFGVGEFLTVNFIISSGTPTSGSFALSDFAPIDSTTYTPISGLEAGYTVEIK